MASKISIIIIVLILVSINCQVAFVKGTNEGSYQYGKWEGSNSGPQNGSNGNSYPTFDNDTCKLSSGPVSYRTLSSGFVMPAVTNTTACQDGWYNGYRQWCAQHAVNCVGNITMGVYPLMILKARQEYQKGYNLSNGSYSICPLGNNAVFCLGWNSNLGERAGECGDNPISCEYNYFTYWMS